MVRILSALVFFLASIFTLASVQAQTQPYTPLDAELWSLLTRAIEDLPMSMSAHQQIQQILVNLQREAAMRAARAKAIQGSGPAAPGEAK